MNSSNDASNSNGQKNIIAAILGKLTPKSLLILLVIALLSISTILGIAVIRGSKVDIFGIKIDPSTKLTTGDTANSEDETLTGPGKLNIKISVNFNPELDENINLNSRNVTVTGYTKAIDGREMEIRTRKIVEGAGISVEAEIPKPYINNPLYIVIDTPPGTWISDDFQVSKSNLKAYLIKKDNSN